MRAALVEVATKRCKLQKLKREAEQTDRQRRQRDTAQIEPRQLRRVATRSAT